jgi:hypothetical protein
MSILHLNLVISYQWDPCIINKVNIFNPPNILRSTLLNSLPFLTAVQEPPHPNLSSHHRPEVPPLALPYTGLPSQLLPSATLPSPRRPHLPIQIDPTPKLHPLLLEKRFVLSAGSLFLVSIMAADMICKIKKLSISNVGRYGSTPKIKTLVLTAYVSWHEKLVFKNKKSRAQI